MTADDVHEIKVDLITISGLGLRYDVRCLTCDWEAPKWHTNSAEADRVGMSHIADVEARV